jgi:hypothetical protein
MKQEKEEKFWGSIEAVWEKLSKIDVSSFVRKKGKFSYLSWSHAYSAFCDAGYSDVTYEFRTEEIGNTETFEVWCTVCLFSSKHGVTSLRRTMWLPVYDHTGRKPKKNPDANDINTARMRCLTKCLSMFGLGMYIYQGEDLPPGEAEEREKKAEEEKRSRENITDGLRWCKAWFSDAGKSDEEFYAIAPIEMCRSKKTKDRLDAFLAVLEAIPEDELPAIWFTNGLLEAKEAKK